MTVLIVVPNYFTSEVCDVFVSSLIGQTAQDWRLVLVDNSGDRNEVELLMKSAQRDCRISVARSPENVGYYNSLRVAANHVGSVKDFEQVWLCNPDLVLDPNAMDFAKQAGRQVSDVGVIAPSLWSDLERGETNPFLHHRPSESWWRRLRIIFAAPTFARLYVYTASVLASRRKRPKQADECHVYAAHGACLIFTSEYWVRGGAVQRKEWLFAEEITVAETCRELGLSTLYSPQVIVRHAEHASTGTWRSRKLLKAQRAALRSIHDQYRPW